MDLTSGAPFWIIRDGLLATYPRLQRDRRCDVAIIGGGITGALVARRFAREGIHVILVERREIGFGSTGATTALILYEIDCHLIDLIKRVGEANAVRSYQLCLEAVRGIEDLALGEGDNCSYQRKKCLYLASRAGDRKVLEREYQARRRIGIELDFLSPADIAERFSFRRPAALLSYLAGEMDAFRLAHKLIADGQTAGLEVYDRTDVRVHQPAGSEIEVRTEDGPRIRAKKVVFATGYETPPFLKRTIVRLSSTFALASAPVERFDGWGEDRCLLWETARPYFYARTTSDGRVMVGGADKPFATAHRQDRLLTGQVKKLSATFARMFPAIPLKVDWSWGGTFGETKDGLPYIGTLPQFPNCYLALGYGGNGITFGFIAAELLLDLFRQRRNSDLQIFGFDR
jgi:glycine/D-amino acid oxidase-like deaminating enzyme